MSENIQESAEQKTVAANGRSEKNFENLRKALEEEKKSKQVLEERMAQLEAKQKQKAPALEDDDDYDEPYINKSKLKKELNSVYEKAKEDAKREAMAEVSKSFQEHRQQDWIKQNPDFYDIMQHAQKFAEKDPELAETILAMPEGFERQKLVYRTIKTMGIHKPAEAKSDIQNKVDSNRKPVFYQPSGTPSAPYSSAGDFSPAGQKAAYEKLLQLKNNLRLG